MKIIKTLLADSQRIFLEGIKVVLKNDPTREYEIVGCTCSGAQLFELWKEHRPDLLLLNLNLLEKHGLDVIDSIRRCGGQKTCILVMTTYEESKISRTVLERGANGYLFKHGGASELLEAIETVLRGRVYRAKLQKDRELKRPFTNDVERSALITEVFVKQHRLTKREAQILYLISQAMNNKEIGRQLFISDQTVSVHRKNIMRKLGVRSTAGLIKMAYDECP